MHTTRHLLLIIIMAVTAITLPACTGHDEAQHKTAAKDVYTCPMHPSVISDRPGVCPVCHMDLVRKSEITDVSAQEAAELHRVSLSPTQRIMANVATAPAERTRFATALEAVGVLDFAEPLQAMVTARFRGRIEKMHVNFTGASVRKGAPLFDLYSPDIMTAQQDYLIAMRALTRAQQSGTADDEQQSMVDGARARLRMHYGLTLAQITELERRGTPQQVVTYYAPIAGTVIRKQAVQGQYIDEGTPVLSIADLSRVWAYLEVSESNLEAVRVGQSVVITTDAYPGEKFAGRVTFIDPVMNSTTRTVRVRAELANNGMRLKPQMYVKAAISAPAVEALAVPSTAVIVTGSRSVVWVEVGQNEFEARMVRTGARSGDLIEIIAGLSEGEMIVTTGGYLLDSESQLANVGTAPAKSDAADNLQQHVDVTPHVTHGNDAAMQHDAPGKDVRTISITVDGGYAPESITLKKGERVRLVFNRVEDSRCSEEVVFPDFGIRRKLPAFKATTIELTPSKSGTFTYSCGMDMLHGTLVVR